jgi:hypothetical protein
MRLKRPDDPGDRSAVRRLDSGRRWLSGATMRAAADGASRPNRLSTCGNDVEMLDFKVIYASDGLISVRCMMRRSRDRHAAC